MSMNPMLHRTFASALLAAYLVVMSFAANAAEVWHIAEGRADIFLNYCTAAVAAQHENPGLQAIQLPDTLAVGADYGLTVINGASPEAYGFAMFILSREGQGILQHHGFTAPGL